MSDPGVLGVVKVATTLSGLGPVFLFHIVFMELEECLSRHEAQIHCPASRNDWADLKRSGCFAEWLIGAAKFFPKGFEFISRNQEFCRRAIAPSFDVVSRFVGKPGIRQRALPEPDMSEFVSQRKHLS